MAGPRQIAQRRGRVIETEWRHRRGGQFVAGETVHQRVELATYQIGVSVDLTQQIENSITDAGIEAGHLLRGANVRLADFDKDTARAHQPQTGIGHRSSQAIQDDIDPGAARGIPHGLNERNTA